MNRAKTRVGRSSVVGRASDESVDRVTRASAISLRRGVAGRGGPLFEPSREIGIGLGMDVAAGAPRIRGDAEFR